MKKILILILLLLFTSNNGHSKSENCDNLGSNLKKAICYQNKNKKGKANYFIKKAREDYNQFQDFFDFYNFFLYKNKKNIEDIEKFKSSFNKKYKNSIFLKNIEFMYMKKLFNSKNYLKLKKTLSNLKKNYKLNNFDLVYVNFYSAIIDDYKNKKKESEKKFLNIWSNYPNFEFINIVENKISSKLIKTEYKINRLKTLFRKNLIKKFKSEYKPYNESIEILRGIIYLREGDEKSGLKILERIASGKRENSLNSQLDIIAEANYQLAIYNLKKIDNNSKSAEDLKKILLKFPNFKRNDQISYLSARLFSLDKNYNEAKKIYDRLIKTKSKKYLYDSYWGLGWSEYMMGNYKDSLNIFAYLEQSKKNYYKTKGMYWKARSLEKLQDSKKANEIYDEILKNFKYGYYVYLSSVKRNIQPKKEILKVKINSQINSRAKFFTEIDSAMPELKIYQRFIINKLNDEDMEAFLDNLIKLNEFNSVVKLSYQIKSKIDHKYPFAHSKIVENYSSLYNVDKNLIYSLMREESLFDENAVSRVKAKGLMQLMDKTKKSLENEIEIESRSSFEPNHNIKLGTYYLSKLNKKFDNNFFKVIASYNAGPHNVLKWNERFKGLDDDEFVENIPFKETYGYVKRVLRSYYIYQSIN